MNKYWFLDHNMSDFEVVDVPGKGKGLIAKVDIGRAENLLVYEGRLLNAEDAERMEEVYERRGDRHCYMLWFTKLDPRRLMCVDATDTSEFNYAKFINHSRTRPNCRIDMMHICDAWFHGRSLIYFRSIRDIKAGEELLFNYGEDRPDVIAANPWLME